MQGVKGTARTRYRKVEQAWRTGDEIDVVRAAIGKYARTIDETDSARDLKPLISGMFDAMDRLKNLEACAGDSVEKTPLFQVIKKASGE